MQYFLQYRWLLRSLSAVSSEKRKVLADIHGGFTSRDILDEDWQEQFEQKEAAIRTRLRGIESAIETMPETERLLPCKIFMRLHYLAGYTLTDVAIQMDVSESTIRRLHRRAAEYFEQFPPERQGE